MISSARHSSNQSLAIASVMVWACASAALAQAASQTMSVTGYSGTTAMVQDPPGSPWRSVSSANLPNPAPVSDYQQDEWVEISNHGRPIRISIMSVQLSGVPSPIETGPYGQANAINGGQAESSGVQ